MNCLLLARYYLIIKYLLKMSVHEIVYLSLLDIPRFDAINQLKIINLIRLYF